MGTDGERRTLWMAAAAVFATAGITVAAAFGVARVTSSAPLWPIVVGGAATVMGLWIISAILFRWWPFSGEVAVSGQGSGPNWQGQPIVNRPGGALSINQQGGVTVGQIHLANQVQPSGDVQLVASVVPDEGRFLTEWVIHLKQQQAANGFGVRLREAGAPIVHFQANPDSGFAAVSMSTTVEPVEASDAGRKDGPWKTVERIWNAPLASGYRIRAWTAAAAPPTLETGFVA